MTLRDYNECSEGFEMMVNNLKNELEICDFIVDKTEIEFAVYDTNINHDNIWINK